MSSTLSTSLPLTFTLHLIMADEEYDEPSQEQQQQPEETPAPAAAPVDDIVSLQLPSEQDESSLDRVARSPAS
jgi:hypothetical protein